MNINFNCKKEKDLDQIALEILTKVGNQRVFCLFGSMGAGKTTLIKQFAKHLGVIDIVTSPTFAIINEYQSNIHGKIFHFDFYRINSLQEVYDLGYEEYFFSGNYCFIEWSEKISELLPQNFVKITITEQQEQQRLIAVEFNNN